MLEFNLPAKIVRFGVLRLLFDLFGKHMSHLSFPDSVFLFDNDGRSLGERLVVNQCFSIFKNIIFVVFMVNFKAGEPITDRTLKKKKYFPWTLVQYQKRTGFHSTFFTTLAKCTKLYYFLDINKIKGPS